MPHVLWYFMDTNIGDIITKGLIDIGNNQSTQQVWFVSVSLHPQKSCLVKPTHRLIIPEQFKIFKSCFFVVGFYLLNT